MSKIVRTKTRAEGGITPEEKERMDELARRYIDYIILRTAPADINKLAPAIRKLYAAADLDSNVNVVLVDSPLQMAFVYGAAAWIWHCRTTDAATFDATEATTNDATDAATYAATRAATEATTNDATGAATVAATYAATDDATRAATVTATDAATRATIGDATYAATHAATRATTHAATRAATHAATYNATVSAARVATYNATCDAISGAIRVATRAAKTNLEKMYAETVAEISGAGGIRCAQNWWRSYQGGAMWAQWDCYLAAARDVLGLELPAHKKYAAWEECLEGGFRCLHERFCVISDHPLFIHRDDNNLPHCENGPSHMWRDGWALYHWHGVRVPAQWIEAPETVSPSDVLKCENVEERAAGAEIIGWDRMLQELDTKVIDDSLNPDIGQLLEMKLPGLDKPGRFLKALCPRNGWIVEGVPHVSDIDGLPIDTAIAAQAWRIGDPQSEYEHPQRRT